MNPGGAGAICGRGHCDDGRRLDDHPVYYRLHCDSHDGYDHVSGHAADVDGHDCPGLAHALDDVRPDDRPACLSDADPRGGDPGSDRDVVDMARPGMGEAGTEGHLEGRVGIRAEVPGILCSLVLGTPVEGCAGGPRATQEKGRVGVGVLEKKVDIHTARGAGEGSWEGEVRGGSQTVEV